MKKYSAVIVDDLDNHRKVLQRKIEKSRLDITVIELCKNIQEAKTVLDNYKPDILFIDIDLGKQTAFDLLKRFRNKKPFEVIFVTGYSDKNDFLLNVIKEDRAGFLSKPIDTEELSQAIDKAIDNIKTSQKTNNIDFLLKHIYKEIKNTITIYNHEIGQKQLPLHEIIYCESINNQVVFHMTDGETYKVSKTLKFYEDLLEDYNFFRIQRSFIINLNHIDRVVPGSHKDVYMKHPDGEKVFSLSRDKKRWEDFMEKWKQISIS